MNTSEFLPIREFSVDLSSLSLTERKMIEELVEAARLIAPIYLQQENRQHPGGNFYPKDASKQEIEEAAKENSAIFDPYTIVERNDRGKLVAIPYHVKYHKYLLPVAEHLRKAATLTENPEFAKRLEFQADALLDGSYEASDIYWLTMPSYKISLVIGPIERYEDKIFFKKCAYQAIVDILDQDKTDNAITIEHAMYDARHVSLAPSEKAEFLDKIQLRVDKTLIFSGFFARGLYTSENLPNDVNLMQKYGTQIMFFDSSLELKFTSQHYPIFEAIFEKDFAKGYSKELLREGSFRNVLLHEIGHSLLRYRNAEERLRELFPIIDELSATIYGIKSFGSLVLKDIVHEADIEAIMIMFICRAFTWWMDLKKNPSVESHAQAHTIALNYFFNSGALKEHNGFSWPNFMKMYVSMQQLSDALEWLISVGSYEDAKNFIDRYSNYDFYNKFAVQLESIDQVI